MLLYHTSAVEIPRPDIRRGRRNADFGQGFYLTAEEDFARRWAWAGGGVPPGRRPASRPSPGP